MCFAGIACAVAYGCGASEGTTRGVETAPASRRAAPRGASEVAFVPPVGSAWVAGLGVDGDSLVVLGGLRARVGVDDAVFGLQPFATEIAVAAETDHGWVFVAEDGTVARSASFTGRLERLGTLEGPVPSVRGVPASRGRLAVVDARGDLFSSDGRTGPARVEALPEPGIVLHAVFLDRSRGAALLEGGLLALTADGGERWRVMRGGPEAVMGLGIEGDEILVHRTDGSVRAVARDGVERVRSEPWVPQELGEYPRARWLRRMALWVFPELVETLGAATLDGRAAAVLDEDAVVSVRPGGGRALDRIALDPETCTASTWGTRVFVLCENRAPIVLDASGRFREERTDELADVAQLPMGTPGVVLSDDGRHAARRSGCADASTDASVCVMGGGSRTWRAVPLPADVRDAEVVAMHGARALLRGTDANGKPLLAVMDVTTGRSQHVGLSAADARPAAPGALNVAPSAAPSAPPTSGGRLDLQHAQFAPDGTLYALARAPDTGAMLVAIGPTEGPLVLRVLPRGATSAAMIDAAHGVASGVRPADLWETRDGGRTWRPLRSPLDGTVHPATHLGWSADPARASWSCRADGCRRGRLVWRRVASRRAPPIATDAMAADVEPARPVAREAALPELICGDPEPVPVTALPAFGPAASIATRPIVAPGARARVGAWRDASGRVAWQMAWSGTDVRGAFVRSSATSPSPFLQPDAEVAISSIGVSYALRVATRRGALVTRTLAPDGSPSAAATEHAWIAAGGGVRVVLDGVPGQPDAELIAADAAPDGGAVTSWRIPSEGSMHVTRLVLLSATGATRAYRDVVTAGGPIEGIAWQGPSAGYVTSARATGGWLFVPIEWSSPPARWTVREADALALCGVAPGRARVSVASPLIDARVWSLTPVLELDGEDRPCVRSVTGVRYGRAPSTVGMWAAGDVLEGVAEGVTQSARIRCHIRRGVGLQGER